MEGITNLSRLDQRDELQKRDDNDSKKKGPGGTLKRNRIEIQLASVTKARHENNSGRLERGKENVGEEKENGVKAPFCSRCHGRAFQLTRLRRSRN